MKSQVLKQSLALALVAAVLALVPVAQGAADTPNCTAEDGQAFIEAGQYNRAVQEFTCLIQAQPTEVEGYRGRIEAKLLLGRYSDALADYARVTAFVVPVHPDAHATIRAGYKDLLALAPDDIPALMGASFERWANYDYPQTIHFLNRLLAVQPNSVYGNLFLGSSRMLRKANPGEGAADLERAIALAPQSPDVRFIVADAYTYGEPDLQRAFDEATLALSWGLDTPRVRAILATTQNAFGDLPGAAAHIKTHFDLVTTELVAAPALTAGNALALGLVPGRSYEIPVPTAAGETISISTSSHDIWDSIAVLLAPDGTPVVEATTRTPTWRPSTGPPRRPGRTGSSSPRSRASTPASSSSRATEQRPRRPRREPLARRGRRAPRRSRYAWLRRCEPCSAG